MSRPRIIWLGNSTQVPVPAVLDQLRTVGEVHIQRELRQLLLIAPIAMTTPADFCIIHWEYAGQWSVQQLNDLAQAWPLTSYIVIVGEWATSATRHGPLWPQAEQFTREDFCTQLALGAEHVLSELRAQQPLLTERWDDHTIRKVRSPLPQMPRGSLHCVCDSNESIAFWQEFLDTAAHVVRADLIQCVAELNACHFDQAATCLLIESDLPTNTIQSWLQAQAVQPRQTVLISSFWRETTLTGVRSLGNCWTLSKPVNLRLIRSILTRNQHQLDMKNESQIARIIKESV
jgi:hypothetical protein